MPRTSKAATGGSSATPGKKSSSKAASQNSYNEKSKLRELFVEELKDIYWAEKHLSKALPKMAKAATSMELKMAFENHTVQTQEQIIRVERAFEILQTPARAKKCEAMEGLLLESQAAIENTDKGTATRDCALIISAQKAEHYEIASYGSLVQLSKTIGHDDIAEILQLTLNEEKETNMLLTELAISSINLNAENETE